VTTYFICSSSEGAGAIAALIALATSAFSYKDIKLKLANNG